MAFISFLNKSLCINILDRFSLMRKTILDTKYFIKLEFINYFYIFILFIFNSFERIVIFL